MRIMPIVYVTDMARSVEFYRTLGGKPNEHSQSASWTEMRIGTASIGLHIIKEMPQSSRMRLELAMVSEQPLPALLSQLQSKGVTIVRPIADEAFGYSFIVADPDGLNIQINHHEH
jgi:predicted lactoylglutathione lyase